MPNRVAVVDVGHGNATVIETGASAIVVDAGPGSALLEYLQQVGIGRVETVLISHADQDHLAGLIAILGSSTVSVGRVRLNTDSARDTKIWRDLLFALEHCADVDFSPALSSNDTGTFDSAAFHLEILFPTPALAARGPGALDELGQRLTSNTLSAVVRVLFDGTPVVLLPGDLDPVGLAHLERIGTDCLAPVLVFPHHGGDVGAGRTEFVEGLMRLCEATSVVFSVGRRYRHIFPNPEMVRELLLLRPDVHIACTQLSQHCSADDPVSQGAFVDRAYALGQATRSCCAGTVRLTMTKPTMFEPDSAEHQAFIEKAVATPMCIRLLAERKD